MKQWRYKEIVKEHVSIRESALYFISECSRATPDLYRDSVRDVHSLRYRHLGRYRGCLRNGQL